MGDLGRMQRQQAFMSSILKKCTLWNVKTQLTVCHGTWMEALSHLSGGINNLELSIQDKIH